MSWAKDYYRAATQWILLTKQRGEFWTCSHRGTLKHVKGEQLAYDRGGYLTRIIENRPEFVSGTTYRCLGVRDDREVVHV